MSAAEVAQDRTDHNEYTRSGREEWRRRECEIKDLFRADLAAEHLPALPEIITDRVFSMAWEEGHSSGYRSVADGYEELSDFVVFLEVAILDSVTS